MTSTPTSIQKGLTSAEAAARLVQYGPNAVATKQKMRPFVAFLKRLNSPLIWIIIFASVVSVFIGDRVNAVILVFMVGISVVLDYVNTSRSEKAVDELISRVVTKVNVIRDGTAQEIAMIDVVPGDIVTLSAGDVIPADGQVLQEKDCYVNQSTLTGESIPAEKNVRTGAAAGPLSTEDPTALFMGTSLVSGYATMTVVATGRRTEFGQIADRLTRSEAPTDFERGIRQFSIFLMRVTIIMVVAVFILNATAHHGWLDSFIFAIAIAIGLTPELLPVILTVSLSRGAVKMAKQQVIVKHLPAIQNFGRMNILCTDKTGTLTENTITVVKYVDGFGHDSNDVLRHAYYSSFFHTGVFNPLDAAIRDFRSWPLEEVRKIDEVPFDFERRRESVVIEERAERVLISKGAPEAVVPICATIMKDGGVIPFGMAEQAAVTRLYQQLSTDGYRVLAVATRRVEPATSYEPSAEHDLMFYGLIALLDPPKQGVRDTVQEMVDLGIQMKILTGDNLLLTEKICRDINLPIIGTVTGAELDGLNEQEWRKKVQTTTIFARIDPEQKEKIITLLSQAGNVVGYLGDGINDAPALKAADVGISVNNAVDVAKETADIILLEHSLEVLKAGVLEGRKTFHNTMKYIMMGLSSNFGNMFSMTVASAFLPFLPMLPTQILLNNFLYDTAQFALSSDTVDDQDLTRPTVWDIKFIQRFMLIFGPISSIFDFLTFGLLLWIFRLTEAGFQTGWFIESIATQVFVIYVIRTRRFPFIKSRPSLALFLNTLLAVIIAWSIPYLPFNHFFRLKPLPFVLIVAIFGLVVVYLLLVQVVKQWFYRREMRWAVQTHDPSA